MYEVPPCAVLHVEPAKVTAAAASAAASALANALEAAADPAAAETLVEAVTALKKQLPSSVHQAGIGLRLQQLRRSW